jgi:hypothetical protein
MEQEDALAMRERCIHIVIVMSRPAEWSRQPKSQCVHFFCFDTLNLPRGFLCSQQFKILHA